MNKHLLGSLLFLPALAHAQTPIPFTVKGKIGQLNAPAKIYLIRGFEVADSATFKNGAFEFKGTTDVPQFADLVIKRDGKLGSGMFGMNDATRVYLEPGPVVVISADSLRKASVTGGPLTADDQRLQASLKVLDGKVKSFGAQVRKASAEEKKSPAFQERMQAQFEATNKEYAQLYAKFIRKNPNSWVSVYALEGMQMMEVPQYAVVGPLYNALSPAIKNSPVGRRYGELVEKLKAVGVGAPAPGFTQKTPDGKAVSLADYRGKYVLVDFWASWCGPCRKENPAVIKVYNEFKARNFEVLGVSLDDEKGRAKWAKAIADDHLPWTQVSDLRGWQNEAAQLYGVRAIPQNFLIDPTGKIVALNLKGEALRTELAKYLK
jgi:peroxiredoxin